MSADSKIALELASIQKRALRVGLGAGALLVVGLIVDADQFFRSWLMAALFWLGLGMGSFGIVLLHQLTGGGWGLTIRRILEAALRTLPVLALFFVPVLLGIDRLYEWSHPEVVAEDPLLQHKASYLNVPFFVGRTVLYFALWIGFARLFLWLREKHDHDADARTQRIMRNLAGPGIALYVGGMSFAATDWAMSLEPHWFSTIYGAQMIVGQGLSTLCLAILGTAFLARREPFSRWIERSHFHDLGNLTLAFVLLWAYTSFSQFLIIWSGNLPEEASWYLHRMHHGWQGLSLLLVVLHFAAPFALLLSRRNKRSVAILARIAAGILLLRLVEMHWLIAPAFHHHGFHLSWMDVVAPVALGGLWLASYARALRGRPLLSLHDAELQSRLEEATHA